MSNDRDPRSGQVPLPGFVESASAGGWVPLPGSSQPAPADEARQTRTEGLRRVRRMSNWTAAALIVGTGGAAVALAHNAVPGMAPTVPAASASSTTATGTTAATHGAHGPQVAHSVATTSASGVTTTTTTHVVNGKTVVTHVQHVPAFHDY